MHTAIYGGTFNPIHNAHLHLLQEMQKRLGFDRVLLIPAAVPPHKMCENMAEGSDRLAMCRLAVQGMPFPVEVSDLELKRQGKSYTSDTLLKLREQYPEDTFYLLMGEDMFVTLESWHCAPVIFREAVLCGVPRSEDGMQKLNDSAKCYEEKGARCIVEQVPFLDISSTEIRRRVNMGLSVQELIPFEVNRYILEKRLYRSADDILDHYRQLIRPFLSDYRYYHSLCVAESCRKLALQYGADPAKAEKSGILHDILKDTDGKTMLQLAHRFGIILDNFEKGSQTLWHARIGSEYLRQELKIEDEDIISAVRWHTTGKAGMNLLEKILFTADFISADRSYPGVEEMRKLAEQSLEEAMLEGLAFTLKELSEKRRVLHPDTLSAYNDLILKKEEFPDDITGKSNKSR